MKKCNEGCQNLLLCSKCDKKLCNIPLPQDDTVIERYCINEGFYLLGEEKVCAECHTPVKNKFSTSPFSVKKST